MSCRLVARYPACSMDRVIIMATKTHLVQSRPKLRKKTGRVRFGLLFGEHDAFGRHLGSIPLHLVDLGALLPASRRHTAHLLHVGAGSRPVAPGITRAEERYTALCSARAATAPAARGGVSAITCKPSVSVLGREGAHKYLTARALSPFSIILPQSRS